jgi:cytoplasmic iron level regulating protein YaaA (DUF328/UPF0246 family)
MAVIALIACGSRKRETASEAVHLYTGTLFTLSLEYAHRRQVDAFYILSAKHGLLSPDAVIEPYDVTLNRLSAKERRAWARKVVQQLQRRADLRRDHFIILAGARYREHLLPHLSSVEMPLAGLTIGKQLQYLKECLAGE